MTNIKSNLLHFVEKNKINMIPRWKFVLYSLLLVVLAIFTFSLLVLIGSMIMFVLTKHGFIYLPLFGLGEILHGIRSIPVILFLLTIVLLIIVEILARQYAFAFRKPIVTTVLTMTLSALVLSFLLTLTPIHEQLRIYAMNHNMAFIVREYDRPLPMREMGTMTVLRGTVVSTTSNEVTLKLFDETTQVIYASTTGKEIDLPDEGEDVVVFGQIVDDRFEAVGIRDADRFPFGEHMGKNRHGMMK